MLGVHAVPCSVNKKNHSREAAQTCNFHHLPTGQFHHQSAGGAIAAAAFRATCADLSLPILVQCIGESSHWPVKSWMVSGPGRVREREVVGAGLGEVGGQMQMPFLRV